MAETVQPAKAKVFTIWPFIEKVCVGLEYINQDGFPQETRSSGNLLLNPRPDV